MSSSTAVADFTNVANWQGVDDEPTAGSENIPKSNGVFTSEYNSKGKINVFEDIDLSEEIILPVQTTVGEVINQDATDTVPTIGYNIKRYDVTDYQYIKIVGTCIYENSCAFVFSESNYMADTIVSSKAPNYSGETKIDTVLKVPALAKRLFLTEQENLPFNVYAVYDKKENDIESLRNDVESEINRIDDKLSDVNNSLSDDKDDALVFYDKNDIEFGRINENGLNFKNVKQNGYKVITEENIPKEDVSQTENDTHEECIKFCDNEGNYRIKIDPEGIKGKDNTILGFGHVYNVKELGAKGDGVSDDTEILQSIIALGKETGKITLYFPKGTYILTDSLTPDYIGDVSFVCGEGAIIYCNTKNKPIYHTYNLLKSIYTSTGSFPPTGSLGTLRLIGGTYQRNLALFEDYTGRNETFLLSYMTSLYVDGVIFKPMCRGNHLFDLSGLRNVTIKNSTFYGTYFSNDILPTTNIQGTENVNVELIQIDVANGGLTKTYDNDQNAEPTCNVLIENNIFTHDSENNCYNYRSIGMHSNPYMDDSTVKSYFDNIVIRNNKFIEPLGRCICYFATKNSKIEGNRFYVTDNLIDNIVVIGGRTVNEGWDDITDTDTICIKNNEFFVSSENKASWYAIAVNPYKQDGNHTNRLELKCNTANMQNSVHSVSYIDEMFNQNT